MADARKPPQPRGPSLAERIARAAAERPEETFEVPRGKLRAASRRDFLLFGLGSLATDKFGRYVESINVDTGTIQITYGKDANSRIDTLRLDIQPLVNTNGDVVWVCGNANDPLNADPDPGDGTDSIDGATSVLDKHMPASCRTGFGGS